MIYMDYLIHLFILSGERGFSLHFSPQISWIYLDLCSKRCDWVLSTCITQWYVPKVFPLYFVHVYLFIYLFKSVIV